MPRSRAVHAAVIACLFAFALTAHAQTSPDLTLRGTIVDTGGAAITGAVVTVEGTNLSATTADDGTLEIPLPAPGQYTIVVKRIGYVAQERVIQAPVAEAESTHITLATAPVPLKPIDVAGTWSLVHARGFALPVS